MVGRRVSSSWQLQRHPKKHSVDVDLGVATNEIGVVGPRIRTMLMLLMEASADRDDPSRDCGRGVIGPISPQQSPVWLFLWNAEGRE